jgi:hypothetical protein
MYDTTSFSTVKPTHAKEPLCVTLQFCYRIRHLRRPPLWMVASSSLMHILLI